MTKDKLNPCNEVEVMRNGFTGVFCLQLNYLKMKQIYEHYQKWEDYNAGMYALHDIRDKDKLVFKSVKLLSDPNLFYETMQKLIIDWKVSTDVNLSNKNQNRRAWLGAAACFYKYKVPEYVVRIAWGLLNKEVQDKANRIANKIILEYETKNNGLHKNLGEPLLF
jgi:hypothetical protein